MSYPSYPQVIPPRPGRVTCTKCMTTHRPTDAERKHGQYTCTTCGNVVKIAH